LLTCEGKIHSLRKAFITCLTLPLSVRRGNHNAIDPHITSPTAINYFLRS
jgi:hypothetical protein